ncbi:MAG: hypothetical protein ACHREM_19580, partial [Polyangiales bacterium]
MSVSDSHSRAAIALGCLSLAGCFLGYDSSFGAQKKAQQHAAARAEHAGVEATTDAPAATTRTLKVRLHATTNHVRETLDWQAHARGMVDGANAVLGPALGVRLEIMGASAWTWASNDLDPTLRELKTLDDGEGVDWVIGLAGGLPYATSNFHQLGIAELVSKHLVVRSVAKLDDLAQIDAGFDRLSADERSALRVSVQRQREIATLLHELGHTLGAVHERSSESFMYPTALPRTRVFDVPAQRVMRAGLTHRPSTIAPWQDAALAGDLVAALDPSEADAWNAEERTQLIGKLTRVAARRRDSVPTATGSATTREKKIGAESLDVVAARLPEDDRGRLRSAYDKLAAGSAAAAWKDGEQLWKRYPDDAAVQELRCQIAMAAGGDMDWLRAECARMEALSAAPVKKYGSAPRA